ncbi:uncharacterized protein LOC119445114 [Dermacentor silvarum]|uniref:uncharacterized protein LOC119445114 n=1 Tax=Dermacentor silvarum TaxID=543639 RepID=UPI0018999CEF|nr:uncharacterized protein LOC119445114 [Dermacentor silvarum]
MTSADADTMTTSDGNVSSSSGGGGSSGSAAGNNETPWADLWWKERVQVASPDWAELRQRVQWLWPVHAYGLACLFLGLAVTAFLTALGLRARLSARPHLSTLNVFLLVLGLTRCLCLFLDPYGSRQLMPSVMLAMLWDLAFPCLLSAFSLLQLAFVQLTQAKPSPARVGDETCVSLVVVFHFCLAIASDLFWAMQNSFRVVWLFTQLSFTAWGLFLCSTCVCSCLRLQQSISQLPMLLFLPPQGPGDAATEVAASSACYDNKGIMALGTLERSGSGGAGRSMTRSYTASGVPMRGAWEALAPRIRVTDEHQRTVSLSSAQGAGGGPSSPSNGHRTASSSSSTEGPEPDPEPEPDAGPDLSKSTGGLRSQTSLPLCPSQLTREQQQPLMSKLEVEFGVGEQQPSSAVRRDQMRRQTLPKTSHSTRSWTRSRETAGSLLLATAYRGQPQPHKKRSRVERLLRQTLLAAVLGIVLCCLQGYGVAGPHGMFAATPRAAAVLPWFAYHTLHRCLELAMACTMASVTRKSLYSNCYRSHSCNEKYRGSLFS